MNYTKIIIVSGVIRFKAIFLILSFCFSISSLLQAQVPDTIRNAKPPIPVYDSLVNKMKPSKEIASIIVNVAMDSTYESFIVENDGKNSYHLRAIAPFAITSLKDTLYYILNRKYTSYDYATDTLFFTDGKVDTIDNVLFTHHYEFPFITRKIKTVADQIAYDKNYKPKKLMETERNWDEDIRIRLRYALPKFVMADYSYHGNTGGPHANWFSSSSILDKSKIFKTPFSEYDLLDDIDSEKFDMAPYLSTAKLDTVKRVLYFKGVDGYFDDHMDPDKDIESFNIHLHDKEKLPPLAPHITDEGVVNYNDINYLVNRLGGYFSLSAQAFAFATYAESGDNSFTASCDVGRLDKNTDPYLCNIKIRDLSMIDRNVFDIYGSDKYGTVVLQRLTAIKKDGKDDSESSLRIINMSNPSTYFDLPANGARSFISVEWLNSDQYNDLMKQLKDCQCVDIK